MNTRGGNPFSRVFGGSDARGMVTPRISYARAAVDDFAARIARRVNRDARDADIAWRDGKLDRTRARNGLEVVRSKLVVSLFSVITNPAAGRRVAVPVKVIERPDRNLDDLARRYPTVIAVDRDAKQPRLYRNLQLEHRYEIAVGKAGAETANGRYKIVEKIVNPPGRAPNKEWAGNLSARCADRAAPNQVVACSADRSAAEVRCRRRRESLTGCHSRLSYAS